MQLALPSQTRFLSTQYPEPQRKYSRLLTPSDSHSDRVGVTTSRKLPLPELVALNSTSKSLSLSLKNCHRWKAVLRSKKSAPVELAMPQRGSLKAPASPERRRRS